MPLTTYVAGDVLTAASLNDNFTFAAENPNAAVVQVKSVTKTTTFTTSSTSFVDVTDLTLTITPTSATNKILAFYSVTCQSGDNLTAFGALNLVRDSTAISQATDFGNRSPASSIVSESPVRAAHVVSNSFLDSPATTAATVYKIQIRTTSGPTGLFVNRSSSDTNNSFFTRATSSLTIMEVTP